MPQIQNFASFAWFKPETLEPRSFVCGYCGKDVWSEKGYRIHHVSNQNSQHGGVFICPGCKGATYFSPQYKDQVPGPIHGRDVQFVPPDLNSLFTEARNSTANGNYTAVA